MVFITKLLLQKNRNIIEVPNSNSISCSNSSLLECSPVTQAALVRFPAETCLSRNAFKEDGDVVKSLYSGDPDVMQTRGLAST